MCARASSKYFLIFLFPFCFLQRTRAFAASRAQREIVLSLFFSLSGRGKRLRVAASSKARRSNIILIFNFPPPFSSLFSPLRVAASSKARRSSITSPFNFFPSFFPPFFSPFLGSAFAATTRCKLKSEAQLQHAHAGVSAWAQVGCSKAGVCSKAEYSGVKSRACRLGRRLAQGRAI